MNLTDEFTLKCLKGSPVFLDDICAIYPATLGEIVDEGYDNFQRYIGIITMNKPIASKKDNNEFIKAVEELSDFQYILLLTALDKDFNQLLKQAFLFFTHEQVFFSMEPAQIIFGPLEEKHLLTEDKFYEFRTIIRKMYFLDLEDEIVILSTDSEATRRIKKKMKENREKLRRAKQKNSQKGGDLKFSDLVASVTINDCNLNLSNIWNITYYAFHDQLKRMGWRDQFNINNSAALAGAKIKKDQLKHWMRSINTDNK